MHSITAKRRAATKIGYLRRLARSTNAQQEADTARRAAAKLFDEFGLKEADVDVADDDTELIDSRPFLRDFNVWQKHLALACANFCGASLCLTVEGDVAIARTMGTPSQRHATVAMYARLERLVFGARVPSPRAVFGFDYWNIRTEHEPGKWDRSFRTGVATGMIEVINEAREIRDAVIPSLDAIVVRPIDFDVPHPDYQPSNRRQRWRVSPDVEVSDGGDDAAASTPPPPAASEPAPEPAETAQTPPEPVKPSADAPPNDRPPTPPHAPPKGVANEVVYAEPYQYGRRLGRRTEVRDPRSTAQ